MRKADFIEQLRQRLVDLGCPLKQVRRLVQEVADHREDLRQAVVSEGLSGSAAETRVDELLGNPLDLAERLTLALRQSTWWGRHSAIGFCILPLLAVPVLWGMIMFLGLWLVYAIGYALNSNQLHVAADNPSVFHHLFLMVHGTDYLAIALVTLLFCGLARRCALGLKCTMVACLICSVYASFTRITIVPHSLMLGASWTPQWIRAAIPLLIATAFYALRWRTTHYFNEKVTV